MLQTKCLQEQLKFKGREDKESLLPCLVFSFCSPGHARPLKFTIFTIGGFSPTEVTEDTQSQTTETPSFLNGLGDADLGGDSVDAPGGLGFSLNPVTEAHVGRPSLGTSCSREELLPGRLTGTACHSSHTPAQIRACRSPPQPAQVMARLGQLAQRPRGQVHQPAAGQLPTSRSPQTSPAHRRANHTSGPVLGGPHTCVTCLTWPWPP